MRKSGVCPKCGSTELLIGAELSDRGESNIRHPATVRVYEKPEALIFKGAHDADVTADVCMTCGFMELYVNDPAKLYAR
ncbi:MAG: hypothetical protein FJY92_08195 [Candidatus Hydrogenedentes bacterium]|nr:hypothetical protein [Candidatus Hydrogenedentota bacterium]